MFFFSCVSLISRVVFLYRKFYISDSYSYNSDNSRFFYLLFLFVVSIFFLVFSNSWLVVILGWDGLGVVSFLLVVYYNDCSRVDSGLITIFTNRLGDCFFILSFSFMFFCGWFSYDYLSYSSNLFFFFLVILGCITKRAQIPFSSWLPSAIAAPTPVSSLVHSSTLVTAGVFLLLRFNFLVVFYLGEFLTFISLCTMVLGGLRALIELDFKKVVAISTLSQLGFMVYRVSCGYWLISFLHMFFHAFFKSVLFLSTGNLMHYLGGNQDSRVFGSLGSSFFSKLMFYIRVISLIGFPFSLGFYSKDFFLGFLINFGWSVSSFFFLFGCLLTVSYSFRLIIMGYMNFPSFNSSLLYSDSLYFFFPITFLYFFRVFFGNMFFFYFFPPECFSFFEFFFGVILIFFGFFIFLLFSKFYFINRIFSSLAFLHFISTYFFSSGLSFLSFFMDYTWYEVFGAKGALWVITSFKFYVSHFYIVRYFFFFIFFLIVLFIFGLDCVIIL